MKRRSPWPNVSETVFPTRTFELHTDKKGNPYKVWQGMQRWRLKDLISPQKMKRAYPGYMEELTKTKVEVTSARKDGDGPDKQPIRSGPSDDVVAKLTEDSEG
jgi:hypothetical protein